MAIISCGAKKLDRPARARDLYIGPYFKAALAYALTLAPEESIFILSAKYGLVGLNERLEPYDLRMGQPGIDEELGQWQKNGIICRKITNLSISPTRWPRG